MMEEEDGSIPRPRRPPLPRQHGAADAGTAAAPDTADIAAVVAAAAARPRRGCSCGGTPLLY